MSTMNLITTSLGRSLKIEPVLQDANSWVVCQAENTRSLLADHTGSAYACGTTWAHRCWPVSPPTWQLRNYVSVIQRPNCKLAGGCRVSRSLNSLPIVFML